MTRISALGFTIQLFILGVQSSASQEQPVSDANLPSNLAASCDAGNAPDCTRLGVLYRKGEGVSQNFSLANRLFARACDAGEKIGCSELAEAYYRGTGVRINYLIASRLADRGCTLGDLEASSIKACEYKAKMYANGHGILQDYNQSLAYQEQSCALGGQSSCVMVAKSLRIGSVVGSGGSAPVKTNLERAQQLAEAACAAQLGDGCSEAASVSLIQGRMADYGVFLSGACDRNQGDDCFALTKALDNGRVATNATKLRSLEHYRGRACALNVKAACNYKSRTVLTREAEQKRARLAAQKERERIIAAERKAERDRLDRERGKRWARGDCGILEFACHEQNRARSASSRPRSTNSGSSTGSYRCEFVCKKRGQGNPDIKFETNIRAKSSDAAEIYLAGETSRLCKAKGLEQGGILSAVRNCYRR